MASESSKIDSIISKDTNDTIEKFVDKLVKLNDKFDNFIKSQGLQQPDQNLYSNLKEQIEKLQDRVKYLEDEKEKQTIENLEDSLSKEPELCTDITQNIENLEIIESFSEQSSSNESYVESEFSIDTSQNNEHVEDIKCSSENLPSSPLDEGSDYEETETDISWSKNQSNPWYEGSDDEETDVYANIQAVVGLDFGAISSGFSCSNASNEENICYYDSWPEYFSSYAIRQKSKINTAFYYDKNFRFVNLCDKRSRIVELFKLYLGESPDDLKPKLPIGYKKVITDYFKEIKNYIEEEVKTRWVGIDLLENVLLVLTVPVEYTEEDKNIMRECIYDANLIKDKTSQTLQFVTESEAAALYCMKNELQEYDSLTTEKSFMIIDCGGCTTDLATFRLIGDNPLQLSRIIGYSRDFCGSSSIDKEFFKFLCEKIETRAMNLLIEVKNQEFHKLIRSFRNQIKEGFDGNDKGNRELYVPTYAPSLMQYVSKKTRKIMDENYWTIKVGYNDIKKMFDPIIDRIIRLINLQLLNDRGTCSAMFLVGGLSENVYLQNRIKEQFRTVQIISVIDQPMCAIANGAVIYGLSKLKNHENNDDDSFSKIINHTFGIQTRPDFTNDDDLPNSSTTSDRKTYKFNPLIRQGTEITLEQTHSFNFKIESGHTHAKFKVYYTNEDDEDSVIYIDEPEVKLLGLLYVELPDAHLDNRSIDLEITFGLEEITVFVKNRLNGQKFLTTFCYPTDNDSEKVYLVD
ncbi:hypothetical protein RclHR1_01240020 [Rhizophagus clarus]|uniref:Hsp70 family protein n=1 Tax=Rhizophagus clarus TaxID=94130 RepID=A0A2Z6QJJ1_9GLOM|nr:hypothetical protein RclHR1_01240020 [Rhizophagus clarus]GES97200.1 hypothetical protein GLOIN_2v1785667 [Rhizophagus clarus]